MLSTTGKSCEDDCPEDEYASEGKCHRCADSLPECISCFYKNQCNRCGNNKVVHVDGKTCVDKCDEG
mgnify:CR=1 FL=1